MKIIPCFPHCFTPRRSHASQPRQELPGSGRFHAHHDGTSSSLTDTTPDPAVASDTVPVDSGCGAWYELSSSELLRARLLSKSLTMRNEEAIDYGLLAYRSSAVARRALLNAWTGAPRADSMPRPTRTNTTLPPDARTQAAPRSGPSAMTPVEGWRASYQEVPPAPPSDTPMAPAYSGTRDDLHIAAPWVRWSAPTPQETSGPHAWQEAIVEQHLESGAWWDLVNIDGKLYRKHPDGHWIWSVDEQGRRQWRPARPLGRGAWVIDDMAAAIHRLINFFSTLPPPYSTLRAQNVLATAVLPGRTTYKSMLWSEATYQALRQDANSAGHKDQLLRVMQDVAPGVFGLAAIRAQEPKIAQSLSNALQIAHRVLCEPGDNYSAAFRQVVAEAIASDKPEHIDALLDIMRRNRPLLQALVKEHRDDGGYRITLEDVDIGRYACADVFRSGSRSVRFNKRHFASMGGDWDVACILLHEISHTAGVGLDYFGNRPPRENSHVGWIPCGYWGESVPWMDANEQFAQWLCARQGHVTQDWSSAERWNAARIAVRRDPEARIQIVGRNADSLARLYMMQWRDHTGHAPHSRPAR